jgi:general secretion pathway protein B
MSFILDALRKSEHDRQRATGPGIADMRPGVPRSRFPLWAVAIAALLLVNIAVVLVLVLRNPDAHAAQAMDRLAVATAPDTAAPTEQPAAAPPAQNPPAASPPATTGAQAAPTPNVTSDAGGEPATVPEPASTSQFPAPTAPATADPQLHTPASPAGDEPEIFESLPTLSDLGAQGSQIPELHLDIHVYAARPAERFVFLNMHKYREGGQTPDGTVVERITRDGVVLRHRGVRFTIPRQ